MPQRKLRKIDEALLPKIEELLRLGISVKKISEEWGVPQSTLYYWCRTFNLSVAKLKNEGRVQAKGRKKHTYHYYLNQAMIKGDMSAKQKKKNLTKFYMHKGDYIIDDGIMLESKRDEDIN